MNFNACVFKKAAGEDVIPIFLSVLPTPFISCVVSGGIVQDESNIVQVSCFSMDSIVVMTHR